MRAPSENSEYEVDVEPAGAKDNKTTNRLSATGEPISGENKKSGKQSSKTEYYSEISEPSPKKLNASGGEKKSPIDPVVWK